MWPFSKFSLQDVLKKNIEFDQASVNGIKADSVDKTTIQLSLEGLDITIQYVFNNKPTVFNVKTSLVNLEKKNSNVSISIDDKNYPAIAVVSFTNRWFSPVLKLEFKYNDGSDKRLRFDTVL